MKCLFHTQFLENIFFLKYKLKNIYPNNTAVHGNLRHIKSSKKDISVRYKGRDKIGEIGNTFFCKFIVVCSLNLKLVQVWVHKIIKTKKEIFLIACHKQVMKRIFEYLDFFVVLKKTTKIPFSIKHSFQIFPSGKR